MEQNNNMIMPRDLPLSVFYFHKGLSFSIWCNDCLTNSMKARTYCLFLVGWGVDWDFCSYESG